MTDQQITSFIDNSDESGQAAFNKWMDDNNNQYRIYVVDECPNSPSGFSGAAAAEAFVESSGKESIMSSLVYRGIGGKVPC